MSSSDEDTSHLADCVYEVKSANVVEKLASLRNVTNHRQQTDYKNLKVSAAFQNHVSKHLDSLLEKQSKFVDVKSKGKKRKREECCVLLLSSSEKPLNLEVSDVRNDRIRIKKTVTEKELYDRARLVAVSGDYVLEKKEIEAWAPETKGKFEIIKM